MKQLSFDEVPVEVVKDSISSTISSKINATGHEDDAFFVGDLGDIAYKYKLWKSELPRVEPYYAVKCNEDPAILATLAQLGTGFDCASKSEIQKVLDLKINPSRIIYANPCKQSSHIKFAAKNNVDIVTFDNEAELHKIKAIYPTARCVLRILPPDDTKAICQLGMKFGCHPKYAKHLLQVAKALQVDVIGVSFHVGSGCWDATAFSSAVASARVVFDIGEKEGFHFELLDIGGGFPGQKNAKITFEEICVVLRPALDAHFPESSGVRIISEPGRFFVASAFTLVVNVIAKRAVPRDNKSYDKGKNEPSTPNDEPHFMYYVNDGVYGSLNCLLFDHAEVFPELPEECVREGAKYSCSIWGPTCDGLDCIKEQCTMPELYIGDWIIFRDMGAYTMCAASTFNGMPKPRCHYRSDDGEWPLVSDAPGPPLTCQKKAAFQPIPNLHLVSVGPDIDSCVYEECFQEVPEL